MKNTSNVDIRYASNADIQKIYYNDLKNNNADKKPVIENVVKTADGICERRRAYANKVQETLVLIKQEKETVFPYLSDIQEKIRLIEDETEKSNILTLCSEIKSETEGYIEKVTELSDRFKNQKIRIVSVGPKSQGKSLFTRLYTGLEENIVAVKNDGADSDKTGAISVIHHKSWVDPEKPEIKVFFKSKDEVLRRLNEFMTNLNIPISDLNISISDENEKQFSSIGEIENIDKKAVHAYLDQRSGVDSALKSGLMAFFAEGVTLNELDHAGKFIKVEDLPKYNDMQNSEKHYLAVDHIDIYVDLKRTVNYKDKNTSLFEFFEISDTKGSSTEAGGKVADKDIFNAIDKSDAVFSLAQVGTATRPEDFYNNVLRVHYHEDTQSLEMLRKRHFVILNLRTDFRDEESLNKTIGHIKTTGVADCVYIGSLKERPVDVNGKNELDTIKPKSFVDNLMLDMLNKIVISTKEYDDNCIRKCGGLADEINIKLLSLTDCLLGIKIKNYDVCSVLLKKIQEFKDDAIKKLSEALPELDNEADKETSPKDREQKIDGKKIQWFGEQGNSSETREQQKKTEDIPQIVDYNKLYCEKKRKGESMPTIYGVITRLKTTGEYQEISEPRAVEGQKNTEIFDEVKSVVTVLYEKMSQVEVGQLNINASLLVKGTPLDIGSFIDGVCANYRSQLIATINEGLARQHEIDVKAELKELFSIVWNELKLNKLFGDFEYDKLSGHANAH